MTFLPPLGSNSSQPSSTVPPPSETPLGAAFNAALAAAKDEGTGNISSPTSGIEAPPLSSSPSWWQPTPYNHFDLVPPEPTFVAPGPTLSGPTFIGPIFSAKAEGPEVPEPGPEKPDTEGPEDSDEPRPPSAAEAANYAAQAAIYAAGADKYASKLLETADKFRAKHFPGEEGKVPRVYDCFLDAFSAARWAQEAAWQAAGAAVEASVSPDTAEFNTELAAADAAEALNDLDIARDASRRAIDIITGGP